MSGTSTIVCVAHDPGGARAVLPVMEVLRRRGYQVIAIVSGPAVEIAEKEFPMIRQQRMEDNVTLEECVSALTQMACGILVSAAGLYNQIEHTMRVAAVDMGKQVVGVLDWWWVYRERFQRSLPDGGIETSFPDWICAMDAVTRAGLIDEGFSADKIVITGAANIESSWERLQRYSLQAKDIREEIGVRLDERCAVFFSEAYIRASDGLPWGGLGGFYREDGTTVSGYTSHGILVEIVEALARHRPPQEKLLICVRPHPMEHVPSLIAVMKDCERPGIRLLLVEGGDPAKLCAVGDIYFGMVSIVLLEAALSGRPVLSVQIAQGDGSVRDNCISNRLGITRPIHDRESLDDSLRNWFQGRLPCPFGANMISFSGAANNIAETILNCLSGSAA